MANYAVIENGQIINMIVADSLESAQELTGFPCVESTDENPVAINWVWLEEANAYVPPAPFASWSYNVEERMWKAPVPLPVQEGMGYSWNEQTSSWDSFNIPSE